MKAYLNGCYPANPDLVITSTYVINVSGRKRKIKLREAGIEQIAIEF